MTVFCFVKVALIGKIALDCHEVEWTISPDLTEAVLYQGRERSHCGF